MENQILKEKIECMIDEKKNFYDLTLLEQVKYLSYFYVKTSSEKEFVSSTISDLFTILNLPSPKNVSDLLNKMSSKNKGILIKNKNKFNFSRKEFTTLNKEFFQDENIPKNGIIVKHISGKKGWTDRNKKFSDFLKNLKGEIIIVDGYYGLGSFHVLDNFENIKVRFLTFQAGRDENEEKITKELQRFKREFPKIELKKYPNFWEIHDRYILSENMLVWIGQGLKDFGDKECFLIGVPIETVLDIAEGLRAEFEERWNKSNNLT